MTPVGRSIFFAFTSLFHPRILWLMVWPMLVSLLAWGATAFVLWGATAIWLSSHLKRWLESGVFFFSVQTGDAMLVAAHVIMALLFIPLVWFTALLILSIFGMQAMVEHVASRRFPQLARRQGGGVAGSLWNGLVALGGLVVLGLVSIPFWLIPPLWPVIPIVIMGWVNQRVLRYDALAEHATREEMTTIYAARRRSLYVLGAILALLAYVPLVGFVAPVVFGLAFIHLLLGELETLRQAPIEGEVVRS
ncbi:MAG: EI24 domain-containing protein [Candidatus Parcubacteria bacterium]|nr:EI24 domain-containing protein [Burkholderiales bacterium]